MQLVGQNDHLGLLFLDNDADFNRIVLFQDSYRCLFLRVKTVVACFNISGGGGDLSILTNGRFPSMDDIVRP
jgi:hypothetical protein